MREINGLDRKFNSLAPSVRILTCDQKFARQIVILVHFEGENVEQSCICEVTPTRDAYPTSMKTFQLLLELSNLIIYNSNNSTNKAIFH